MSDAPERVWVCYDADAGVRYWAGPDIIYLTENVLGEYVRADIHAAAIVWAEKAEAEVARLREALSHTAEQALAHEIPVGYGPEDKGAWTQGYDAAIRHARKAAARAALNPEAPK